MKKDSFTPKFKITLMLKLWPPQPDPRNLRFTPDRYSVKGIAVFNPLTMNTKEQPILSYTEDFIISCSVFRLLPEEVLANFMRLLKVDSYLLGTADDTANWATLAFSAYFKQEKSFCGIDKKHRYAHRKWSRIFEVIFENQDLEQSLKIKQLNAMALACHRDVSKRYSLMSRVQLPDTRHLQLTGNFVVLCFMRGINPAALLQDFISRISWVKDFALNGSEESQNDPWMAFMAEMLVDYFQDPDELHLNGFFDQHIKMDDLIETMKDEPVYEKRLSAFRDCLKSMYHSFHYVPIAPCFLSDFVN